jgi:hypothetical protein
MPLEPCLPLKVDDRGRKRTQSKAVFVQRKTKRAFGLAGREHS